MGKKWDAIRKYLPNRKNLWLYLYIPGCVATLEGATSLNDNTEMPELMQRVGQIETMFEKSRASTNSIDNLAKVEVPHEGTLTGFFEEALRYRVGLAKERSRIRATPEYWEAVTDYYHDNIRQDFLAEGILGLGLILAIRGVGWKWKE